MTIAGMAAFAKLNKLLRIIKNQTLIMPHVNGRFIHKLYPVNIIEFSQSELR